MRRIIISAAAVSVASAFHTNFATDKSERDATCSNLARGLLREDCEYLSSIGVSAMGLNGLSNNGRIWIGSDGPNHFTFTNRAGSAIVLLVWQGSSFVSVVQPYISYSLSTRDSVRISVGEGVTGAFAALYGRTTKLNEFGQVNNTWGEFMSGQYATINVSREPNMSGNSMEIRTGGGCVSNMDKCVFKCHSGNRCGEAGEYFLQDCEMDSQDGNPHLGYWNGQPEGGCGGWENGGTAQIDFLN